MSESGNRLVRRLAGAVLLWLLVPAGAQVGLFLHDALNPGGSPDDPSPLAQASLVFGVVGLVIGVAAAVALSLWFKLGIIWFGVALVAAAILSALAFVLPPTAVVILLLLAPPLLGALAQWAFDEGRKN